MSSSRLKTRLHFLRSILANLRHFLGTGWAAIAAVGRATGHTAAEMRHIQVKAQRTIEKIEKGEIKSHRERVKDFNDYLGNLTEHYDLPKVRAALTRSECTLVHAPFPTRAPNR